MPAESPDFMIKQPGREIVAALNRTFESGVNSDGSTNINTSLMRTIASRNGSNWSKVKGVLNHLKQEGYVTISEDPEHTEAVEFGCVHSFIPEL
jgi:hypothetical protein